MPSHTLPTSPGHYLIPTSTLKLFRGDILPDSPLVSLPHPFCVQRREAGTRKGSSLSNTFHTLNYCSSGARPPNSLVVLDLFASRLLGGPLFLAGKVSAPPGGCIWSLHCPQDTGVLEKVLDLGCSLHNYFSVFPSHLCFW